MRLYAAIGGDPGTPAVPLQPAAPFQTADCRKENTTDDELLRRNTRALKDSPYVFGPEGEKRGAELLDKYLLEGAITQEEYEKLLEENRTMECDEVWVPEGHND